MTKQVPIPRLQDFAEFLQQGFEHTKFDSIVFFTTNYLVLVSAP